MTKIVLAMWTVPDVKAYEGTITATVIQKKAVHLHGGPTAIRTVPDVKAHDKTITATVIQKIAVHLYGGPSRTIGVCEPGFCGIKSVHSEAYRQEPCREV